MIHNDENQAIANKILKLLRLAEGTDNPHEAEAAFAKARALLAEHDMEAGEAAFMAEGLIEEFVDWGYHPRLRWCSRLATALAEAFSCSWYKSDCYELWFFCYTGQQLAASMREAGKSFSDYVWNRFRKGVVFFGFKTDVQVAAMAYDSARHMIQRISTAKAAQYPTKQRYIVRMSFADGLVDGLAQKLAETPAVTYRQNLPQGMLVPLDTLTKVKKRRVHEYEESLGLNYRKNRGGKCSAAAYTEGVNQGKTLTIAPGVDSNAGNTPAALERE